MFAADVDPDPNVVVLAEARQTIEVDETGNAATAQGYFAARGTDGTVLASGAARAEGTRLEVRPVVPLGTPMAGTPMP